MPNLIKSFPVITVCVLLIVSLASGFKLIQHNYRTLEKSKTLENKFLETQLQLKEQELRFLKMQIHPHFLFNSLNTIYGFALKKVDEAPEMILKLSNLLDYILYQVEKPTVSLQNEINHLEDYIALEKLRFHDTLKINFDRGNFSDDIFIAPMMLIPFVENSFKHGSIIEGCLRIEISLMIKEDVIAFEVVNSMLETREESKGIGLGNIQKRLEMLYPDAHSLEISQGDEQFRVSLELNIKGLKTNRNIEKS